MQMRTKDMEREMQESEFGLAQHELEIANLMELEEQRRVPGNATRGTGDAEGEELAERSSNSCSKAA